MGMAKSATIIDHIENKTLSDNQIDKIDYPDTNYGGLPDVTGFASKALIQKVLKEHVARINVDTCEPGEEDAFYVADLGEVYRQHLRWKLNLARVKPFYGKSSTHASLHPRLTRHSGQM
jgi:ornithine decarboxylase